MFPNVELEPFADPPAVTAPKSVLRDRLQAAGDIVGGWHCLLKLYRNKDSLYFARAAGLYGGVILPHEKDNGGHQDSPINGRLKGLFFNSKAFSVCGARLPPTSPFGRTRVVFDVRHLIRPTSELYFADFVCMKLPKSFPIHYAIVVVCESGSKADLFARRHLIRLRWSDNPLLERDASGRFRVADGRPGQRLWVEVFLTEAVDTKRAIRWDEGFGEGSSERNGIPADPDCRVCNPQPRLPESDLSASEGEAREEGWEADRSSSSRSSAVRFSPEPHPRKRPSSPLLHQPPEKKSANIASCQPTPEREGDQPDHKQWWFHSQLPSTPEEQEQDEDWNEQDQDEQEPPCLEEKEPPSDWYEQEPPSPEEQEPPSPEEQHLPEDREEAEPSEAEIAERRREEEEEAEEYERWLLQREEEQRRKEEAGD